MDGEVVFAHRLPSFFSPLFSLRQFYDLDALNRLIGSRQCVLCMFFCFFAGFSFQVA